MRTKKKFGFDKNQHKNKFFPTPALKLFQTSQNVKPCKSHHNKTTSKSFVFPSLMKHYKHFLLVYLLLIENIISLPWLQVLYRKETHINISRKKVSSSLNLINREERVRRGAKLFFFHRFLCKRFCKTRWMLTYH